MTHPNIDIDHLEELIDVAKEDRDYMQPPFPYVEEAVEEFEAAYGVDARTVPWGAIAMRAHELREAEEEEEE